ncbi:MAG: PolC-type DNA polymerase III [Firmicutes bacterium]|nr:PolC-type DNA polymerase III [Bacillota bacterium]
MHDKLELLLKQVNMDESDYIYFKDGNLDKINISKKNNVVEFIITLTNFLEIEVHYKFYELLKKHFNTFNDVLLTLNVVEKSDKYLNIHFDDCIKRYALEFPLLEMFIGSNIKLEDNNLIIEVSNKAEEMKIKSLSKRLINDFKSFGYGTIEIKININEEKSKEIKEEIENEIKNETLKVVKKDEPENVVVKGKEITGTPTPIRDLLYEEENVLIEASVFGIEFKETPKINIITMKVTDGTDSIYCKIFERDSDEYSKLQKALKNNKDFLIRGSLRNDAFSKELVISVRDMMTIKKDTVSIKDEAIEKRIELHAHTKMSQMDGLVDAKALVKQAYKWGHKAIAITDHNGCQSFPDVYHTICDLNKGKEESEKFKAIYGTELTLIDDSINIVLRENDTNLMDNTYVVWDFETTGFNAGGGDSIIEVGAVKILNGEIIDRFNELVNPGHKLNPRITEVTNITNEMLEGKPNEEEVIKRFIAWFGDLPMVAHNAKFDVSFLEMAYKKYDLGTFNNTVIDTLELSRTLDNNYARHGLSALVKRYNVPWDENAHHRADYDAEGTALVYHKMMMKLIGQNKTKLSDLNRLVSKDEIHKYGRAFHVNLLVKNKVGLKNLFQIISMANTKYLYKTPRILRSEIDRHREGLLVGSGCYESEVFIEAKSKSEEELTNIINFYDYVEVQPLDSYSHLIDTSDFGSQIELIEHIKKVVNTTKEAGKIIVATGDVHYLTEDDKIYREIIINQKVPGGGRHPLARNNITHLPNNHFRTTNEMLECFNFLSDEIARELVIENPSKIADMCEIIEVIIETGGVPFSPKIDKSVETVTELVYGKASDWYGEPLPFNIEERIAKELYGDGIYNSIKEKMTRENYPEDNFEAESFKRLHEAILKGFDNVKDIIRENLKETNPDLDSSEIEKMMKKNLGGIIGGGFDVIYLIAQKLVKKSNDDGYLVGSRGSVGSSFVATMMGITEVNPLAPHYRCPNCKHSVFDMDGSPLGANYLSGFDLPDLACPKCETNMLKDGNDMPFATFLGFNADKVPDIDLNFSDLNQADAHEYTKVLFGVDNVYRAGTIGTVAEKTAFGFVKGYCEDKGITKRTAEIERLAAGCTGVKRTTGQHPGGIVVVPGYMDVFDFTPFQFPADDPNSAWRTTHFDYHAIDQDLLKLDILGHSDPTQLRMIQDLSHMDITKVPLDDKETMGIFLSPKPLGVTKEQILNETGTLGIPEFGTPFTINLVAETKPTTFAELIKISGLSHGTDVWVGNAQDLIKNNVVPFKEVIGCRDDIMVYLMYKGMKPIKAFKIMEFVRKGKASKDPETWAGFEAEMREAGIEEWYIDSCRKIKYMFPKAHATAYVTSAFRIAYFKVHHPSWFYASWFSTKATDFDIESMIKGYDTIKAKMSEIINKGYDATNKENGILECLRLALEMTARGLKFANIDLNRSDALNFKVDTDNMTLIPPFRTIDGLGDTVAQKIVEERQKGEFLSIEDLQKRGKVSGTLIDKMRSMGILDGMDESSQLSLF